MTIFFSVVVIYIKPIINSFCSNAEGSESGLGAIGGAAEPLFGKSRGKP